MRSALEQKKLDIEAKYAQLQGMRAGRAGVSPAGIRNVAAQPSPGAGSGGGMQARLEAMASRAAAARNNRQVPASAAAPSPTAATASATHAAASDPAVAALFDKHAAQLRAVFDHYADAGMVSVPSVVKLGSDFDIVPTFLSRKELKAALGMNEAAGFAYDSFVDALKRIALNALSKQPFANIYPTDEAKVTVLLEMWGLGDPAKLAKAGRG